MELNANDQAIYSGLVRLRRNGFKPKNVIDIGAHTGSFTFLLKDLFRDANVLMIEALEEKGDTLKQISEGLSGVDYSIAFLGKDEGTTEFYVLPDELEGQYNKTGSSRFKENTSVPMVPRIVDVKTLDSITKDKGPFDFIKLDVQGAEIDVLEGATETLKGVDFLFLEVSLVEYNEGAPLAAEVITKLDQLGFRLYDIIPQERPNNLMMQFDAFFVRKDSEFVPKPPFNIG